MASVAFLQTNSNGADQQTYTFSGENLGTAAADRYIIVAIQGRDTSNNTTIDTVTIGGVTATISVQTFRNDSSNSSVLGLAVANVPTGTTGDVVVTFNTTMLRCGIALYSTNAIDPTAFATDSEITNDPTLSFNVPANGIAVTAGTAASGTTTFSWSNITEDSDFQVGGETSRLSTASDDFASAQTPLSVTMTVSSSASDVGVAASYADSSVTPADPYVGTQFFQLTGVGT